MMLMAVVTMALSRVGRKEEVARSGRMTFACSRMNRSQKNLIIVL